MELTKKDRVILINQYNILKRLDPDNSGYYDELIEILQNGYQIFYSKVDEWICDDMPAGEGRFVLDLLDIYRMVEHYKHNNPADKELDEHPWGQFRGFDGNNETEYFGFTNFVIGIQGKFTEQEKYRGNTDGFNSHMQVLEKYKGMVRKWHTMGRVYETSKTAILEILDAEA